MTPDARLLTPALSPLEKALRPLRWRAWQAFRDLEARQHPLRAIFWETTHRCNLQCGHCGSSCGPRKAPPEELTTGQILAAIRTIAEDLDYAKAARSTPGRTGPSERASPSVSYLPPGQPRAPGLPNLPVSFYVTGGEPLLREDLFEVTSEMHALGFDWGMVTNGTLVTGDLVARCRRAGMNTVTVSLDGLQDSHDRLRGAGTFRRTRRAVELFLAEAGIGSIQTVEVATCVNRLNIGELEDMRDLWAAVGIHHWRLIQTSAIGRAAANRDLLLRGSDLRRLLEFIKENRKVSATPASSVNPHRRQQRPQPWMSLDEEGYLGRAWEGQVREPLFYCPAGITVGSILYDGAIGACPSLPRNLVQGNIAEHRFMQVWNEGYAVFRDRSWMRTGACASCRHWGDCRGNSLHLWDFKEHRTGLCHLYLLAEAGATQGAGARASGNPDTSPRKPGVEPSSTGCGRAR